MYPYYGATGILDYVNNYIFDEKLVLIGEDGAKWEAGENTAFIAEGKYWVNNHAHVLRPHRDMVLDNWIIFFFYLTDLTKHTTGLTVPKLNQENLRNIEIPIPLLAEQKRVVGILNEVFEGINRAKENAEKNLKNSRELFESYLQSVFGYPKKSWEEKSLNEIANFRNGINYTKQSRGELIKIVGVKDFQKSYWAPVDDLASVRVDGTLSEVDSLRKGDILIVRSNGNPKLIGRCLLVGNLTEKTSHSGFTIRVRLNSNHFFPQYVCHYLKSEKARKELVASGTGINIKSLNQVALSSLVIPFPPLAEQKSIVKRLDALSEQTKKLEAIYKRKLENLEELKKSVLKEAFAGKL